VHGFVFTSIETLSILFTNVNPGEGTLAAYTVIRDAVSHLDNDRILSKDIDTIKQLMQSGKILEAVENKVGKLQ
jgi:histidine ammonia-lyase